MFTQQHKQRRNVSGLVSEHITKVADTPEIKGHGGGAPTSVVLLLYMVAQHVRLHWSDINKTTEQIESRAKQKTEKLHTNAESFISLVCFFPLEHFPSLHHPWWDCGSVQVCVRVCLFTLGLICPHVPCVCWMSAECETSAALILHWIGLNYLLRSHLGFCSPVWQRWLNLHSLPPHLHPSSFSSILPRWDKGEVKKKEASFCCPRTKTV